MKQNKFKNSRIIGILPESIGGRLTTSSILDGFEQNGIEVSRFDKLNSNISEELKALNLSDYDFIVSYDYVGLEFKVKLNLDIPTINYFSDVIADDYSGKYWEKYHDNLNEPDNYTFYWDEKLTEEMKSEIKNIHYLPHCVNTEIYKNLNLKAEYDVMFAGRLFPYIRLNTILSLVKKLPDVKFGFYCYKPHFDSAIATLENPDDKELMNSLYAGFIETEEEMAIAINKTKMVLNFNTQAIGALNYRTFQVIACEKLLLSDERSELFTLFSPYSPLCAEICGAENLHPTSDRDVVYYKNNEELEFLIKDYFYNPDKYAHILKNGRNTMVEKYSAQKIVKKMIEVVNEC